MQRGLRVLTGPKDQGQIIALHEGTCTCGRSSNNSICLPGEKVSKRHCSFTLGKDQFFIKDLQSRNGTFVNGNTITEVNLKTGDRVQIGEYVLEVVSRGGR